MEAVLQNNAKTAQDNSMSADKLENYSEILKTIKTNLSALVHGRDYYNSKVIMPKTEMVKKITSKSQPEFKVQSKQKRQAPVKKVNSVKEVKVEKFEPVQTNQVKPKAVVKPEDIIPLGDF